jgi:hypothetical protein
MPESVDLHSSGLRRSSSLAALYSSETIEAHSTLSKTIIPSSTLPHKSSETIVPSSKFPLKRGVLFQIKQDNSSATFKLVVASVSTNNTLSFDEVGNSLSTQLVGSCHDKKSERVGNSLSTQLVGSCHNKKSE